MTGTQIKTQLSKIIDSLVEEGVKEGLDREEAVDRLIKIIEFNREDL